ncbi:hypothetical protein SCP_0900950 [Sparassis crispa]|uniref:RBR-type E3 ubiquitin transferase n=1 Tax=Sparassis crispa TaxID=139825 RepID=A0A401GVI3_9APHY|nr:hypothetical protein SCP_0900950 [Sparassis crispa]GBE86216.1 hypothetical protein SCP_0900950 [Sparassis crispa]
MDSRSPICSFYLRNGCARGQQCRFYHPPNTIAHAPLTLAPSTFSTNANRLCVHFVRGDCRFGDRCRDRHVVPDSPAAELKSPILISPVSSKVTPTDKYIDDAAICLYFRQGSCRFGDQCRLLHTPEALKTASLLSISSTGLQPSNEQSWSASKAGKVSVFGPCKFFVQGRCTQGAACLFPHVAPVQPAPVEIKTNSTSGAARYAPSATAITEDAADENHSQDDLPSNSQIALTFSDPRNVHSTGSGEDSIISRQFLGCSVQFSSGASIDSVITAFESPRIIISNLPLTMTQAELIELTERHGDLKTANLTERVSAATATALVEYTSPDHASMAVKKLDGKKLGALKLSVRLDLRRGASGAAVLQSNKVKLTWFAPSRVAWAHFDSISAAKAVAQRINGQEYDGRKVSATFQTPSPFQRTSFAVELKGLPVHVTQTRLSRWCLTGSLKIGQLSYDEQASLEEIQSLLRRHGALDAFDVLPNLTASRTKITAFAQFGTAEAAADAVNALHRKSQAFLRYSTIYLDVVHAVKGVLPKAQYVVIKEDLERLCATLEGCKMRFYDRGDAGELLDSVGYRIYGANAKAIGRAKLQLDRLLDGEILISDVTTGGALWDEYFQSSDGRTFLDTCDEVGIFVKTDPRTRVVRLFGPSNARSQARARILVRLAIIKGQRHSIPLERGILPEVMNRMHALQEAAGSAELSLNVVARTLVVRGDDVHVERVRRAVASLSSSSGVLSDDACCPVCFCDVSDPSVLPCGHSYCRSCLQLLLLSSAGPDFSLSSLVCIQSVDRDSQQVACGNAIPTSVLRDLLSPPEETRLLTAAFLAHIHARPDEFHYCPTPDCEVVYRTGRAGAVLQCPVCVARICPACHCEFHEGMSCAEYHDNVSGGHEAYNKWRLENGIKPCPKCKADLQKNGGCNHIKCVRCGTHMCWVCMETFSDSGTGGGVYEHMRRAHGGIGA